MENEKNNGTEDKRFSNHQFRNSLCGSARPLEARLTGCAITVRLLSGRHGKSSPSAERAKRVLSKARPSTLPEEDGNARREMDSK
eukprot:1746118-Pyramimonas_sp.AAC.1